jgi:hypothetical protein
VSGESHRYPAPLAETLGSLGYTPDGKLRLEIREVVARTPSQLCLIDSLTGKVVGKPLGESMSRSRSVGSHGEPLPQQPLPTTAISPDGKWVVFQESKSGESNTTINVYLLPQPVQGSAERITLWVQVLTGMELDADGVPHDLDADTWKQRKQRLQELGGPPMP